MLESLNVAATVHHAQLLCRVTAQAVPSAEHNPKSQFAISKMAPFRTIFSQGYSFMFI